MSLVGSHFGVRTIPEWTRADIDLHVRMGSLLVNVIHLVKPTNYFGLPYDTSNLRWNHKTIVNDERASGTNYMKHACRLHSAYMSVLEALDDRMTLNIEQVDQCYKVLLKIDTRSYACSHYTDYMQCMVWVLGRIHLHFTTYVTS